MKILGCLVLFFAASLWAPMSSAHGTHPIEFNNIDITGSPCCRAFRLTDHHGKIRTLADYKGNVVVVTFGFTSCPDVCPMTMAGLRKAMVALGKDAEHVTVLFVTLDPERDTGPVLARYLASFDPAFVGLRSDPKTIARTAKDFRVFYKKATREGTKNYLIDHTLGSYVFDAEGKPRVFVANDKTDLLVSDIRSLLGKS